jgi:hypothetical protein
MRGHDCPGVFRTASLIPPSPRVVDPSLRSMVRPANSCPHPISNSDKQKNHFDNRFDNTVVFTTTITVFASIRAPKVKQSVLFRFTGQQLQPAHHARNPHSTSICSLLTILLQAENGEFSLGITVLVPEAIIQLIILQIEASQAWELS